MREAEQLLAIEAIKQCKARYFRCMDTKNWAGFEAVFTPDVTVDYTPASSNSDDWKASGHAKVTALVQSLDGHAVTIHHGHMPEVELTGPDNARAIFAMEDLVFWPEGSRFKSMHGWGHYHETYEKLGDRWLIKTLKLTRLRVVLT